MKWNKKEQLTFCLYVKTKLPWDYASQSAASILFCLLSCVSAHLEKKKEKTFLPFAGHYCSLEISKVYAAALADDLLLSCQLGDHWWNWTTKTEQRIKSIASKGEINDQDHDKVKQQQQQQKQQQQLTASFLISKLIQIDSQTDRQSNRQTEQLEYEMKINLQNCTLPLPLPLLLIINKLSSWPPPLQGKKTQTRQFYGNWANITKKHKEH